MRLRHKPWVKEAIQQFDAFVFAADNPPPATIKGNWRSIFPAPNPLSLEIGSGKGDFITGMAEKFTEKNFIGLEVAESVLYTAAQKVAAGEFGNIRLVVQDAKHLPELFAPGEIDEIYINFCDPWPKKRHAKRRLTHRDFLTVYRQLCVKGGRLCLKTDNAPLFEFSLGEFQTVGLNIISVTRDLYAGDDISGNVPTEYEKKFNAIGTKICRAEVIFP